MSAVVAGPATLGGLVREGAERDPSAVAYAWHSAGRDTEVITRGGLAERAGAVGAMLAGRVAPGGRVVVATGSGPEFLAGFLGCQLAGLAAVPVVPPSPARPAAGTAHLARIVADCAAEVVLTGGSAAAGVAAARTAWPGPPVTWLDTAAAHPVTGAVLPDVDGRDVALLQYTSGSTSAPKGVVLRHEHLLANLASLDWFAGRPSSGSVLSWLPVHHDMGLIGGVLYPLSRGLPGHLMSPLEFLARPLRWLEVLSETGATISGGPGFAYRLAAARAAAVEPGRFDLSGWEVAFNGAEPIDARVLDDFERAFAPHGLRPGTVVGCYGMAEASLLISGRRRGDGGRVLRVRRDDLEAGVVTPHPGPPGRAPDPGVELAGSGRTPPGHDVRIVEAGGAGGPEELPGGWVGEIWFDGPSVGDGYHGDDEASRAAFGTRLPGADGRYLRTGDLGFRHEGSLFVTGRRSDLMIVRGRNIHPHDVEIAVAECDARFRTGGGVVAQDGTGRVRLVQEVTTSAPDQLDELLALARTAALDAVALRPDTIDLVAPRSVRRTTSGKPRRRATLAALDAGDLTVRRSGSEAGR